MKKNVAAPLILVIVVLGALTAAVVFRSAPPAQETKPVATTIFPIYDIARHVAGDAFAVTLILQPGSEPHSFEPTPSLTRELKGAKVVYAVGHGLDAWADTVIPPSAARVTVDKEIAMRGTAEPFDPHYWLTVPNAKKIAATMAADMKARFPEHAAAIGANLESYLAELDALDAELHATLANVGNRSIITFHDAWEYFAEGYGLRIEGTFEPAPGREPTPGYLQELKAAVERCRCKTLYTEPLFDDAATLSFAADNGLKTASIDDIGGTTGRDSYTSLMRYNAQTIRDNQ